MAGYITRDHRCEACGHTEIYMHDRGNESEYIHCEECGGPSKRILTATFIGDTSASFVDGSGRLDHIREQRKIEREFKRAKRQGRKDDVKKLATELGKQKATH